MLRLVPPAGSGQEPRSPHKPRPRLTEAENARLRVVLRNLRRAYGTWQVLANIMGAGPKGLQSIAAGRYRGSHAIAVFAARAAGLPLEEVLTGGLALAKHCPLCGAQHRGAAQAQAQAKVAE